MLLIKMHIKNIFIHKPCLVHFRSWSRTHSCVMSAQEWTIMQQNTFQKLGKHSFSLPSKPMHLTLLFCCFSNEGLPMCSWDSEVLLQLVICSAKYFNRNTKCNFSGDNSQLKGSFTEKTVLF